MSGLKLYDKTLKCTYCSNQAIWLEICSKCKIEFIYCNGHEIFNKPDFNHNVCIICNREKKIDLINKFVSCE